MFYIVVETYPGGYVLAGSGEDESAAITDLNAEAAGFPTPPPPFASVEELQRRFDDPNDELCSLYAGTDEDEYNNLLEELLA